MTTNNGSHIGVVMLEQMVHQLRVNELQLVLRTAGLPTTGKKPDLLQRTVEMLRARPTNLAVQTRIKELHCKRFAPPQQNACQQQPTPSALPPASTFRCTQPPPPINRRNASNGGAPTPGDPTDVKRLRGVELPFYDTLEVIIPMVEMVVLTTQKSQEMYHTFSIPDRFIPQVGYDTNREPLPRTEVQMRFFALDTSKAQPDDFAQNLIVRIDERNVTLPNIIPTNKPNAEPKRLSRPVDVTACCQPIHLSNKPYRLHITWATDRKRRWAFQMQVVRRVSADILLRRLEMKDPIPKQQTKELIKQKLNLDCDDDISTDSYRLSVTCPLGKQRLRMPAKSRGCRHINCFDADLFLRMNEKRPTWRCPCPGCDTETLFSQLVLDQYYVEVLRDLASDTATREIEVYKDGHWRAVAEDESDDDDSGNPPPAVPNTAPAVTNAAPAAVTNAVPKSNPPPTQPPSNKGGGRPAQPPPPLPSAAATGVDDDDDIIILDDDDDEPPPSAQANTAAVKAAAAPPPPVPVAVAQTARKSVSVPANRAPSANWRRTTPEQQPSAPGSGRSSNSSRESSSSSVILIEGSSPPTDVAGGGGSAPVGQQPPAAKRQRSAATYDPPVFGSAVDPYASTAFLMGGDKGGGAASPQLPRLVGHADGPASLFGGPPMQHQSGTTLLPPPPAVSGAAMTNDFLASLAGFGATAGAQQQAQLHQAPPSSAGYGLLPPYVETQVQANLQEFFRSYDFDPAAFSRQQQQRN